MRPNRMNGKGIIISPPFFDAAAAVLGNNRNAARGWSRRLEELGPEYGIARVEKIISGTGISS